MSDAPEPRGSGNVGSACLRWSEPDMPFRVISQDIEDTWYGPEHRPAPRDPGHGGADRLQY